MLQFSWNKYERGSGFCDIALSEPLLKLRPRKDLVETLLHEMIHAYLFVTNNDRDRDGHGPIFKAHMYRINKSAGLNITIYHDFIEEVKLYQTHVWRCNGPCQLKRPHFGIVRSSVNRAPGPFNYWWNTHRARCGGTFIKIKEPDVAVKKKVVPKSNVITNYIPNNKIINNVPKKSASPVLKDSNRNIKSNKNKAGQNNGYFSPKIPNQKPLLNLKGQIVGGNRPRSNSADVIGTLRNVWGNKQFPNTQTKEIVMSSSPNLNPNKHKLELHHLENTPAKIKKIDDYFKSTASGVLKNIYGEDIKLAQSSDGKKLIAVADVNLVSCPICNMRVKNDEINRHLDECLNKDVINTLSKGIVEPTSSQVNDRTRLKEIVGPIPIIPQFKEVSRFKITNEEIKLELPHTFDTSFMNELFNNEPIRGKGICATADTSNQVRTGNVRPVAKKLDFSVTANEKSSDNIIKPTEEKIHIKIEPGTSKDVMCPCCSRILDKPLAEHLEECIALQKSDWKSTELDDKLNTPIVIDDDDDDILDESLTLNATGTKTPCPCCLKMIEQADMNDHLDVCLN